jgi:predicted kinase
VELVVLVGLQASGKSTFFHERFAETHQHVSKDLFPHKGNKNGRQEHLLRAALSAGRSVVVDNTNPTPEDRWCGSVTSTGQRSSATTSTRA